MSLQSHHTAMASRMRNMFHRKKSDDAEEPQVRTRTPYNARTDPAIRTLLYEDTSPAAPPQTGDSPLRGNDSSVILQQGRKPSVKSSRSRRSSDGHDNVSCRVTAPRRTPPPTSNAVAGAFDPCQQVPALPKRGQNETSRSALPQDFSGLNLGGEQCKS